MKNVRDSLIFVLKYMYIYIYIYLFIYSIYKICFIRCHLERFVNFLPQTVFALWVLAA